MEGHAEATTELEADEAVQGGADDADEVDRLVSFDAPAGERPPKFTKLTIRVIPSERDDRYRPSPSDNAADNQIAYAGTRRLPDSRPRTLGS